MQFTHQSRSNNNFIIFMAYKYIHVPESCNGKMLCSPISMYCSGYYVICLIS